MPEPERYTPPGYRPKHTLPQATTRPEPMQVKEAEPEQATVEWPPYHYRNLMSFRALSGGLLLGFLVTLPFFLIFRDSINDDVVGFLFVLGFAPGYLLQGYIPLYCARCTKRLSSSWKVCSRCGLQN